ncbi:MAG: 5-methyltetrahydropteroyltriglutamate--homocysteine S-methyltransferase [Trichococcus flocculiformis]|jgi:5-methyltetrahydropteroyltriglutamate--homocysteine methyltransferase|uniref:5-methyltetrahydropteroyltriglutamate-- homocysteine S-methyltransferase n=1 Tax=Trichococcus TaxID=82802 RepID=UPI000E7F541D|nr:5-methyltetrahydropteroyltriglutamate--homocysteine S-methyltransferase [Trichococcus sp. K1Tr]MBP6247827.1 5-methyltetrahydropteroyltriglutamate--homocysteine S-methyltransferase [Trichococcus sp.]HRG31188.1 5-methyltetrahydropteroyltriglutamate--homocysteine S-methyltransferase [Trichococcus flocculiformis]MBP7129370.1 5-methyltetrahydropteroyltriglutamate--homocysteine S-methyltransferase [Trichococcus sp.]MBP9595107.1 5-methyltetrahydropteroyltriglutamate--homocysteine S-methyltransferas
MNSSVIGFPRVGKLRELKFASEKYFKQEISTEELEQVAKGLREMHWNLQQAAGISHIPSNDFSYYDNVLDLTVLLNALPENYRQLGLSERDTYFAAARGYQGVAGDAKALAMKKWFNTNYHYLVPELSDNTEIKLVGDKPFVEYEEAKAIGVLTKPVLIGGFTFLKLAKYKGSKTINDFADQVADAYIAILDRFNEQGVEWVQFDEPSLVTDLTQEDVALFTALYEKVLAHKGNVKVLLQTYFGDIRDSYEEVVGLDFDGIGLDFIEGKQTVELLERYGFPADKTLFAGVLNGKNIWKSDYKKVITLVNGLKKYSNDIVISTSCSLLHVPYTLENETSLPEEVSQYFAFAKERLQEIKELTELIGTSGSGYEEQAAYLANQKVFSADRVYEDKHVQASVASLTERDFVRNVPRQKRRAIQKEKLQLGLLPTTTIGSFPQTREVKQNRSKYRKGAISKAEYDENIKGFIKECIDLQEELGLDVLVHGESERNDMVEFFGENLAGYVFTEKAWVQSYGTRCVKPPIIFGDIRRENPITVFYSEYAQSLSDKPVKGMLTGPVTILNWSFPREDISLREMAFQIGLAIREEVLDLEEAGIKIIQIDEAALKEKLPIRREEWASEYLDWAIPAFRLCHSGVRPETQVHTHMCYSEFEEIVKDIDNMDADVISFEASRSKLTIIDALKANQFETEVGPGVYDIHSPRVPSVEEMVAVLKNALTKIDEENLWINPDCGLKTRGIKETRESLANLVAAAKIIKDAVLV